MTNPVIKVLVVDDSAFMRKVLTNILSTDPEVCVVGQARDGADALKKLATLMPDVITLDIEMPVMDGLTALKQIMRDRPTPVVMVSSLTQDGAEATMRCLEAGAVDFIGKPSGPISLDIEKISDEIISKVKSAAWAKVIHGHPGDRNAAAPQAVMSRNGKISVVGIGSSTGGPRALQQLIPMLPTSFRIPIVIIQHMPPGFTATLAERLEKTSHFTVREAENGDRLTAGTILIAPGGHHLVFDSSGLAHLNDDPPLHGVKPSIDITFSSLIKTYGSNMLGVILTGMGKDGARSLKDLADLGGTTFAEDESTCVVYGMPKAAYELGGVGHLLPITQIASALTRACGSQLAATR